MADGTTAQPRLTIAIPTYNRAAYLRKNLEQLQRLVALEPPGSVEVLVSDNCSPDATAQVVADVIRAGCPVRSVRNSRNLGWARNFIQCFDLARGRYVLILGDDDLLLDGSLTEIMGLLDQDYGVVCLQPYGYDIDFRAEHPGAGRPDKVYDDAQAFLLATSRNFTMTSACIVNKSLLTGVNSGQFIGSDLAAFHLVLKAALRAPRNRFVRRYLVACKRQNSFAYDYFNVFVGQFWKIVDAHAIEGLRPRTIARLERKRLLSYYPFYVLDFRRHRRGDLAAAWSSLRQRFGLRPLLVVWLGPIVHWPRPLGLAWGVLATAVGRTLDGQAGRMLSYAWRRFRPRRTGMGSKPSP